MSLLAVDLGLRTGLALFGSDGRLAWYRSHNLGTPARLKRAARGILADAPGLTTLALEGGGPLADLWAREGRRQGLDVLAIHAGQWREAFLLPREQTSGAQAKRFAADMARRVIRWSKAPNPTSLRHDAAEAILTGLWAVLHLGWLDALPGELRR